MKTLKSIITVLALFVSVSAFSQNVITSENVKVTINGETSRQDLALLRKDMLAVGVDFQYQPSFDQNRRLTAIQYNVKRSSDSAVLGETSQENLSDPSVKSVFHLVKTGEVFTTQCFGHCPN